MGIIPLCFKSDENATRELVDKCMSLETELWVVEPLKAEVMKLRADIQKLSASHKESLAQMQALNQDLTREQDDFQQLPALRKERGSLHQRLIWSRTTIEYENEVNTEQYKQRQAMEKNLISMAREVEKPIEMGRNSEAMQALRSTVMILAWRSTDRSTSETCHRADGVSLNLWLYRTPLRACFDSGERKLQ